MAVAMLEKLRDEVARLRDENDMLRREFGIVKEVTAAAEVGETEVEALEEHLAMLQEHAEIKDATIERCAQVIRDRAAQYDHQNNNQENALWNECMEIIAAIRALKDTKE